MDASTPLPLGPATLAWLGFAIGGVFGFAPERGNFCTMGEIAEIFIMIRRQMQKAPAHSDGGGRAGRSADPVRPSQPN